MIDIIIIGIIISCFIGIVMYSRKQKKAGKGGCCGSCSQCLTGCKSLD